MILAARSAGETVSVQAEDQGGETFSARITCPLSDAIDFSLTFQIDGENRTQTVGQAIQMRKGYSLQPEHRVLYTSPYMDKKLEKGHFPKGTVVPLEYTVTFDQMSLLTGPIYVNAQLGVFVNDKLDHWVEDIPSASVENANDTYFSMYWRPEVDLSGLDLKAGDQITLALSLKDSYDRSLSQVLWRGNIDEDGYIQEQTWGEEEAYPPVEEARPK